MERFLKEKMQQSHFYLPTILGMGNMPHILHPHYYSLKLQHHHKYPFLLHLWSVGCIICFAKVADSDLLETWCTQVHNMSIFEQSIICEALKEL